MVENHREIAERVKERLLFFRDIGAEFIAGDLFSRPSQTDVPKSGTPLGGRSRAGTEELEAVGEDIRICRKCPLAALRTKVVPGEGNPKARLLFVGEAPGAEEDLQGRPFVGRAGRLLDRIIAAMGFSRGEVFIANVLKCRPPNNRDPLPEEVRACSPFLLRQVSCIGPEVIVALGKPAATFFLGREASIGDIRGTLFEFQGIPVMPTYHPAFLLRNERFKGDVWKDMQRVMALLAGKR